MTTVIPFLPSDLVAPKFKVVLDGNNYDVLVTWNISAQRYYIDLYDLNGNWVVTTPLVQSPPSRSLASFIYNDIQRTATITMVDPSLWPVPLSSAGTLTPPGTMVDYTLENFDPTSLNQTFRSMQINNLSFSFPLANDPGQINILGSVARYINMVGGLFNSTLIYRNGAFEVTP
jgi:hypothetical protein